jgi:hypothetical protein
MTADRDGRFRAIILPLHTVQNAAEKGLRLRLHAPGLREDAVPVKEEIDGESVVVCYSHKRFPVVRKGTPIPTVRPLISGVDSLA